MNSTALKGWQVVVLRPKHLAQPLLSAIEKMGATPISLPSLTITSVNSPDISKWQYHIQTADWIIVSSQNAVHFAPQVVLEALRQSQAKVITMGQATTAALLSKGVSVFFTPMPGTDSEKLLTESFLQENEVANKKIVLLAGIGGRTLLNDTLTSRQATVEWVKVYRQEQTPLALASLMPTWQGGQFCFIATSQNSLEHFLQSVPANYQTWLQRQVLIVASPRIAAIARKWEIQHIYVANGAHQEQLCATLLHVSQFCHTMT
jgi:uroporphyrinogen-III synthase